MPTARLRCKNRDRRLAAVELHAANGSNAAPTNTSLGSIGYGYIYTDWLAQINYTTPDLVAKVTGKAKYSEDFRAEGMLFAKLLLSPMPHARITKIDTSAALALPGVKAILTADDLPQVVAGANLGEDAS